MAKQGMKRPSVDPHKDKRSSTEIPVPEIQGKARHGHKKSNPIKTENREDI